MQITKIDEEITYSSIVKRITIETDTGEEVTLIYSTIESIQGDYDTENNADFEFEGTAFTEDEREALNDNIHEIIKLKVGKKIEI